jgi:endo-1,4-beta-xylanase
MKLTRRDAMAGPAVALAAAAIPAFAAPPARAPNSLDGLARKSGRRFGSALGWSLPGADAQSFAIPAYAGIL